MNQLVFQRSLLILFFITATLSAFCQQERFASRIYFPGLIGINIPSGDEQVSMRSGFSLLTAIEYRPTYAGPLFLRFNYDALSNKYKSLASQIPTNVTRGKLTASFFLLGMGYRRHINNFGIYALFQPGLNSSGYNTASANETGVSVGVISSNHLAYKISAGFEYYIVPHFALVAEPAFYHLFNNRTAQILNPNYISYNIGFTTTLF